MHVNPSWYGALLLVVACDEPSDPSSDVVQLTQAEGWERVADADQDVFGAERPDGLICDEVLGILVESFDDDVALEIDTDQCDYVTVRQPSLAAVAAGDTVTIRLWHDALEAPMPAQGHVALAIDGEVAWETMVPIPSEADRIEQGFVAERDIPAGAELQFHIHNHGANTWDLIEITASPSDVAG